MPRQAKRRSIFSSHNPSLFQEKHPMSALYTPVPVPVRQNPPHLPLSEPGASPVSGREHALPHCGAISCNRSSSPDRISAFSSQDSSNRTCSAAAAGHGKDRPFLRLHNSLISGLASPSEMPSARHSRIDLGLVLNHLRKSAEKLGKNNAGISSCAAQGTGRRSPSQDASIVRILNAPLLLSPPT